MRDPLPAYKGAIARRMFIETADNNYILARIAWFNELDWDFWWLGLHAVEKYLKATLLTNDRSAKRGGHDVVRLYSRTLELDPRMPLPDFRDPEIEGLPWRPQTVLAFMERLNDLGSAENRYNLGGYVIRPDDLIKLDQLVWMVRRRSRRLRTPLQLTVERRTERDHLYELEHNPTLWTLSNDLPIERLVHSAPDDPRRAAFLQLNTAFAPDAVHQISGWSSRAVNPPLSDWYMRLTSEGATPDTRRTAADVLGWARSHIQLSKSDAAAIDAAIQEHVGDSGSLPAETSAG